MLKKTLAFALTLVMILGLVAGCSQSGDSGGTTTTEPTPTPNNTISAITTTTTDEENKQATVEIEVNDAYKLCEPGEVELEFWYPMFTVCLQWINDLNDNPIMKVAEQTTGVHINWIHPNQDTASETYNLLFVSNDMPDLVKEMLTQYPGGVDVAIADGYYIDMRGKEEFFPNYYNTLKGHKYFWRDSITDSGNYRGFGYLYDANLRINSGTGYRKDVFDDLGLEMPELISDWDAAFAALKDAGYSEFVQLDNYGVESYWSAAYETYGAWLNRYGEAVYGPAMEEYKAYLLQMQDWYKKGYILQDVTYSGSDNLFAPIADGSILVTTLQDATTGSTLRDNGSALDPDFYLAFAYAQRLNENQYVHTHYGTRYLMHCTYVTTACATPEIAMRWCDFWYTEEGIMMCQYGVEGLTFYYDENGYPWLNEYITNNPDGVGVIWMLFLNTFMGGLGIESLTPRYDLMPSIDYETKIFTDSNFGTGDEDWNMPSVSFTSEEGAEYSKIFSDIETYVAEYTVNCIMGVNDIESTWDDYVSMMNQMGLAKATEIQQAALTRFLSRGQ